MDKHQVIFKDLGIIEYKSAWDYQEKLLQENVAVKTAQRKIAQTTDDGRQTTNHGRRTTDDGQQTTDHGRQTTDQPHTERSLSATLNLEPSTFNLEPSTFKLESSTTNYLLFCEHPAVYTLGKSGNINNVLMSEAELEENHIQFFNTNRGGDITFHGLQQIVGYPILDLEQFYTDIGKYLRNIEEMVILTIAEYGIKGERSKGETGVWIDPGVMGKERKICAIGVRCSRWITMHGFALNVNTDLSYFNNIIPCGIQNKQVTSIEKELGKKLDYEEVKEKLKKNFEIIFESTLVQ